jgi:hypothetical protein
MSIGQNLRNQQVENTHSLLCNDGFCRRGSNSGACRDGTPTKRLRLTTPTLNRGRCQGAWSYRRPLSKHASKEGR